MFRFNFMLAGHVALQVTHNDAFEAASLDGTGVWILDYFVNIALVKQKCTCSFPFELTRGL